MVTTHTYDALVVGAGGAGMRAAIELSDKVRTAVVSKLYPTRSHTGAAQGGVCAALGNVEEDSPEWHAFDTVKGGDYLTDQPAAQLMTEEAVEAIYQLERWGLPFNRTPEGRIDQRRFGGHTANHGERPVKRACYAADRTGHMILLTLYQQCVKRDVRFFNEFYCLDLLRDADGATAGIVAGQQATLSWSVQAPSTCGAMRVLVDNFTVGRSGSMNVAAIERSSAVYEPTYAPGSGEVVTPGFLRTHYVLRVAFGSATRNLDTAHVDVVLPVDAATGRPKVTITANHEVPLLLLGLTSRRADVVVQNHVELDLTGYQHIYIASGVQLIGGRSSRAAGPLIYVRCTAWEPASIPYCSSAPNALFQIHGDVAGAVRITGLRIRGVDADNIAAENATNSHGIVITSALGVEIDNNRSPGGGAPRSR